jgi:hypothetical protein
VNVGNASGDKNDWKFETYAVILSDGETFASGHGDTEEEIEDDQVDINRDKLETKFQFDSSGKIKLRDSFLGINVFESRSKVDPGSRRCVFKAGVVTSYNLVEPVRVLWSSRNWDVNRQDFKQKPPTEDGYSGPFEFVVTRGKRLAITGMKDGARQVIWFQNPNDEDWTGRLDD